MDWKHKYRQQIMRPWEPGSKTDYDQKKWNLQTKEVQFCNQKESSMASTWKLNQLSLSNSHGCFFSITNGMLSISVCFLVPLFLPFLRHHVCGSHISIFCLHPEALEIYMKTTKCFPTSNCRIRGCKKNTQHCEILAEITMHQREWN